MVHDCEPRQIARRRSVAERSRGLRALKIALRLPSWECARSERSDAETQRDPHHAVDLRLPSQDC
jgi:hypothetical protein